MGERQPLARWLGSLITGSGHPHAHDWQAYYHDAPPSGPTSYRCSICGEVITEDADDAR